MWRKKLDENMVKLKELPASSNRTALIAEASALRSEQTVQGLVRKVLSAS
jgi:hypothetical protein